MGTRCADHVTPLYPQKLALTSPTGGGRSVGIVRSRTKATEFFISCTLYRSTRLRICATNRKVAGSIPYALIGPWVDSASHRNEYQGYLMTGKGGRCVRLTALLTSCADFLEIPQPPGALTACPGLTGIALPFYLSCIRWRYL